MTDAFFTPLTHESVLAVRGPEAKKFLQGQLTCNLDYLENGSSSLGARCTPKGRMLSSFRILPQGDGYLLALDKELLEPQMADLHKYAVFSKVRLSDESAAWRRFGIRADTPTQERLAPGLGQDGGATSWRDGIGYVRLDNQRLEAWVPTDQSANFQRDLAGLLGELPLPSWLLTQIRAGVGQVFGATRELFIPQMINLQAVGGVSFRKGCYTGQEIVARMQYLGKLKRHLYRLTVNGSPPALATQLFSPVHGSAVGEVVLAAPAGRGCELLAVVQDDAVTDNHLHLGGADGPSLQVLDLPYALDKEQEVKR